MSQTDQMTVIVPSVRTYFRITILYKYHYEKKLFFSKIKKNTCLHTETVTALNAIVYIPKKDN